MAAVYVDNTLYVTGNIAANINNTGAFHLPITLKGNNNSYVSGENGTVPMNCNRATIGGWEEFRVNQ